MPLKDYPEEAGQSSYPGVPPYLHTPGSSHLRAARWPDRHSPLTGTTSWTHKVSVAALLVENGGTSPVEGVTRMIRGLEHEILQGKTKKTVCAAIKEKKGDLITVHSYSEGREEWARLFLKMHSHRARKSMNIGKSDWKKNKLGCFFCFVLCFVGCFLSEAD